MAKRNNDTRKRNWTFVVYADSAPDDWRVKLANEHVPMFVSPLHANDLNPDNTPKKPHWHVVVMFTGKQPEQRAQAVSALCSNVKVQQVKDIVGMARYLCHLDNPEKAQYLPSDVLCLGGADYLDKVNKAADTDAAVSEMMDWCIEQQCYSFFHLSNYARKYRSDWFRVLSSARTMFLTAWLKSYKWELDQEEVRRDIARAAKAAEEARYLQELDEEKQEDMNFCPSCGSVKIKRNGTTAAGTQRWICKDCGKSFV